jgi:hypothetical protein
MSRYYAYDPPDRPVVGGISAKFDKSIRDMSRGTAVKATQRVLPTQPFEPTGDIAFDLRAKAIRDALEAGTRQAFEESHEAFKAVGLYISTQLHLTNI